MAIQKKTRQLLLILLVASLLNGISWAALIPMWQTPDEQAHFAQAQDIAAIGYRPNPGASTSQDIVLSEKYLGTFRDERGNNRFTYHPEFNIEYTNSSIGMYEKEMINFPEQLRTDFMINEAAGYPPLYYLYISVMDKQFWNLDLISRVFLSRVATVLLSVGLGAVVFYIGKIVFKEIFYAYVLTALVVFQPMRTFVGSGVTSDALMNLIYPISILLLLKAELRPTWRNLTALILALIALLLTKTQGVFLILISLFLWLKVIIGRNKKPFPKLISALMLLGMVAVIAIGILNRTPFRKNMPRFLANILIPEVADAISLNSSPFFIDYIKAMSADFYHQVLPWYWGVYRWLSLTLPLWIYRVIKIIILASLFGWVIGFKRFKNIVNFKPVLWLMASSLAYTIGIYAWSLLFWKSHGFPFGIQGRYFFPNLPEHMIILLAGLLLLVPRMLRKAAGILLSAGMMIFNWYSLLFVSESYYGSVLDWKVFFLRASQYKPWFFKTPFLPFILAMGILTSGWFLWKLVSYTRSKE